MRLAPQSLAGQLTLLLLIALAAAQGIAVALFARERLEALRHRLNQAPVPVPSDPDNLHHVGGRSPGGDAVT